MPSSYLNNPTRSGRAQDNASVAMFGIVLLGFALRAALLSANRFHPDESLYASFALKIADARDVWLSHEVVDKSPLAFYLGAAALNMLGAKARYNIFMSELALRLPALAASTASIALAAACARKLHSAQAGLFAGLLLALSPLAISFGATLFMDALLSCALLASLLLVLRGHWAWSGCAFAAAQRAGVKRLVLTSSIVPISSGKGSGQYGTDAWSDTNANIGTYAKSKTLAERAAWSSAAGGEMELTVINPGFVLGPSLGAEIDGASVKLITDMIGGKLPMIPNVAISMIDVRDVARLHVKAMTAAGAAGERFIAATAEPVEMAAVARVLKEAVYSKVPSRHAPAFLLKFMSLFDREVRGMLPSLGKRAAYDNRATFDFLDWMPTPIETSIKDMAATIST